jgi:hypothetical protein
MADPNKVVTNPIEVIWAGAKGNYGVVWQVLSLVLLIYCYAMLTNGWNGLQGRNCNPTAAAIDIRDGDRTIRFLGCGSRSILEILAGEGNVTPEPAPNPAPPNLIDQPQ